MDHALGVRGGERIADLQQDAAASGRERPPRSSARPGSRRWSSSITRYGRAVACLPTSKTSTTLGCPISLTTRPPARNRWLICGSPQSSRWTILSAARLPNRGVTARRLRAIPPSPMRRSICQSPTTVPGSSWATAPPRPPAGVVADDTVGYLSFDTRSWRLPCCQCIGRADTEAGGNKPSPRTAGSGVDEPADWSAAKRGTVAQTRSGGARASTDAVPRPPSRWGVSSPRSGARRPRTAPGAARGQASRSDMITRITKA